MPNKPSKVEIRQRRAQRAAERRGAVETGTESTQESKPVSEAYEPSQPGAKIVQFPTPETVERKAKLPKLFTRKGKKG
jgi:hypothetical protein